MCSFICFPFLQERQERLKSLQVQFTAKSDVLKSTSSISSLSEGAAVDVLGDSITGYVLNVVREKGEEVVRLPPSISLKLKAHQVTLKIMIFHVVTHVVGDKSFEVKLLVVEVFSELLVFCKWCLFCTFQMHIVITYMIAHSTSDNLKCALFATGVLEGEQFRLLFFRAILKFVL